MKPYYYPEVRKNWYKKYRIKQWRPFVCQRYMLQVKYAWLPFWFDIGHNGYSRIDEERLLESKLNRT